MDDILSHQGIAPAVRAQILSSGGTATTFTGNNVQQITYPKTRLVGLGGYKRHGKDALAGFLATDHGWAAFGMSEALHGFLMRQNPLIAVELPVYWFEPRGDSDDGKVWAMHLNPGHYSYVELTKRLGFERAKDLVPGYRKMIQRTGTEAGRYGLFEDIWVWKAEKKLSALRAAGQSVAVTGIRYPNELEMIQKAGGLAVWVWRDGYEIPTDTHSSENSLKPEDFDIEIRASDLEELQRHAYDLSMAS